MQSNTCSHPVRSISDRVKDLNFPFGSYVVVGGAMEARGIRRANDIDIVATSDLFGDLQQNGWQLCRCDICRGKAERGEGERVLKKSGLHAQVFSSYSVGQVYEADTDELIKSADVIDGVPYVKLTDLLKWKRAAGRSKDVKDVSLLEAYLRDRC